MPRDSRYSRPSPLGLGHLGQPPNGAKAVIDLNYLQVTAAGMNLVVQYDDTGRLDKAFHFGVDVTAALNVNALIDAQNAISDQIDQMAKDKAAAAEWAEWEARMMSDPAMMKASSAREAR